MTWNDAIKLIIFIWPQISIFIFFLGGGHWLRWIVFKRKPNQGQRIMFSAVNNNVYWLTYQWAQIDSSLQFWTIAILFTFKPLLWGSKIYPNQSVQTKKNIFFIIENKIDFIENCNLAVFHGSMCLMPSFVVNSLVFLNKAQILWSWTIFLQKFLLTQRENVFLVDT